MISVKSNRNSFYADALTLCGMAIEAGNPSALVLIGGNPDRNDSRQKEIFDLVNVLHRQGQMSYWYKSGENANLDIPDQVVPGQSYTVVDLDDMSFDRKIDHKLDQLGKLVIGEIKSALDGAMTKE